MTNATLQHAPIKRLASMQFVRRAFTLIELIVVIAVITVLLTIAAPALWNISQGSALNQAGNLVVSLIEQTRQQAVSKNTMSALVLLTDANTDQDYRAFTQLEYHPDTGWNQPREWEFLPEGIIVDFTASESSFLANSPPTIPFLLPGQQHPPLQFNGKQITAYKACIFMPSGSLKIPDAPTQLRLVSGHKQNKQITYSQKSSEGKSTNYWDIAIIGVTGATKVSRP